MIWTCRNHRIDLAATTRVMGIINVTPDSFSDGGLYYKPTEAISRARNCVNEGADILDIGGESTRPGAAPLAWQREWLRIEPVLHVLVREFAHVPISVDTYHPETAERALAEGAAIINCVYTDPVPEMLLLAQKTGCGLVVPCRSAEELAALRIPAALVGPDTTQVLIDPEIGFGTTREQDLALLASLHRLARLAPVCIGVSRKRLVKKLTGERVTGKNLGGNLGAAVWSAMNGAAVVRVHDVQETRQAIDVARILAAACPDGLTA